MIPARIEAPRHLPWSVPDRAKLALAGLLIVVLALLLPGQLEDEETQSILVLFGVLGAWRYGWWFLHLVRAGIYARATFPMLRVQSDALWTSGWRPKRVLFMVTTFRERRSTTERVFRSIVNELRALDLPGRIFVGTGDESDEAIIEELLRKHSSDLDLHVRFVRQNSPGKRAAIGLTLRAISRAGVDDDDVVVFMDGDTYLTGDLLEKCLPLFALRPELDAATTDEASEVNGPTWVQQWLDLRFAQRHIAMQSHALSGRIMTLTGRLSLFRAKHVVTERFIRLIEADYLDNWFWGRFRFLSGDDKSTVFALYSRPGPKTLLYVPDAVACTIEHIEGRGYRRSLQNVLRWTGNSLRNGVRMIALGPWKTGAFIWWCMVDQRLSMWTSLVGPLATVLLAVFVHPAWLLVSIVWIASTRFVLSLALFRVLGRVELNFMWMMYLNQIVTAFAKVYMLFRLPKQRWFNRGYALTQRRSLGARAQSVFSNGLNLLYVVGLAVVISLYVGIIEPPSRSDLALLLHLLRSSS